jgi:hypothetical protein
LAGQPTAAIGRIAAGSGAWFFVDAGQAAGTLVRHLQNALEAEGVNFRSFPERHRSTIVSVPVSDPDAVMARLRGANVMVSVRAGRIRLACHFYNL